MKEALIDLGGAPIQIGLLWSDSMAQLGSHFNLLKNIKNAVDPNNIMAPGIMNFTEGRAVKNVDVEYTRKDERNDEGVLPFPFKPPSQLPTPLWFRGNKLEKYGYADKINAAFRCTRCGACISTDNCHAMSRNEHEEAFTPRARMIVLRKLLENKLDVEELAPSLKEAIRSCTLCGRCNDLCFANVAYREGISPEPNIDHREVFSALKCLLGLTELID